MMRKVLLWLCLVVFLVAGCQPKHPGRGMNVVFVVVDALRADHLMPYGYSLATSPFMTKLAAQGAYFKNAYAQAPWTNSSIASLFTGLDPSTHKVVRLTGEKVTDLVPDSLAFEALTMAEVFEVSGYDTLLVSANPWFFRQSGLAQGFEELAIFKASTLSKEINSMAVEFLKVRKEKRKPFFLYLHYMDLHGVYRNPPEPYGDMFTDRYLRLPPRVLSDEVKRKYGYIHKNLPVSDLREYLIRYDRSIRFVDAQIEWLWNELGAIGLKANTIFIVTADHGEAFLDHGVVEHGTGLHQEQIRVPLFIWRPGVVEPGPHREIVQLEDIFPTLVEFMGLDVPDTFDPDGMSFARLLEGKSLDEERSAWSENHIRGMNQVTLIINGKKWFYDLDKKVIVEIYDLSADPGERKNLFKSTPPERVREVEKLVRARFFRNEKKSRRLGIGRTGIALPDGTREDIKALGYIE